jgi:gliding motility-associated-like protein
MQKKLFLPHWSAFILLLFMQWAGSNNAMAIGEGPVIGCTDPTACNFDPSATEEDGSCVLPSPYYPDGDSDGYGNMYMEEYYCELQPGYVDNPGDCDDSNSNIYLGSSEICNGLDDDCDGELDNGVTITFYQDADGDGFGWANQTQAACDQPVGYVYNSTDCDDNTWLYADLDGDGYGSGSALDCGDVSNNSDCDDSNPSVFSVSTEVCNGLDDDCDGETDNGVTNPFYLDADGDGFGWADGMTMACESPVGYVTNLEDCDDNMLMYADLDGDGYGSGPALACGDVSVNGDCDDNDPSVLAMTSEVCNGLDDDCDGEVDNGVTNAYYLDADGDGFGWADDMIMACELPIGYVTNLDDCDDAALMYADLDGDGFGSGAALDCGDVTINGDCDDANQLISPAAIELCGNEIDEDCNGWDDICANFGCTDASACNYNASATNEDGSCFYPEAYFLDCVGNCLIDTDGDGICDEMEVGGCIDPSACNYNEFATDPGACVYAQAEICNGLDEDCDGEVDNGVLLSFYIDADGDGFGSTDSIVYACAPFNGFVENLDDCDDSNLTYEDLDGDAYGIGNPTACGSVFNNLDCDDNQFNVHPEVTELCNNIDDNCNDEVDEGVTVTYYLDADGDGFGSPLSPQDACDMPLGYVDNFSDCDDNALTFDDLDGDGFGAGNYTACGTVNNTDDCMDNHAAVNPDAIEVCNGIDDDCDLAVDEFVTSTYYADADGDGFGDVNVTQESCELPQGFVINFDDCDDNALTFDDLDSDGFGVGEWTSCGTADNNLDCNDADNMVYPEAIEVCNLIDDDCDEEIDEFVTTTYYLDADGDGFGTDMTTTEACELPVGYVTNFDDCDDSALSYEDMDGDGFGAGNNTACGSSISNSDCDDADGAISPGTTEVCGDGIDNDCQGGDVICIVLGCTDPAAFNYNPAANTEDGTCVPVIEGCTDAQAFNYDPTANTENGTCIAVVAGCTDAAAINYNPSANTNDGSCIPVVIGCMDATACNYNPLANTPDNSCYTPIAIYYNCDTTCINDTDMDGVCNEVEIVGCMDPSACNYDMNATDAATCIYASNEVCNNLDDDCDGEIDNGVLIAYYSDADGDGFGNAQNVQYGCSPSAGYVSNSDDCDDAVITYQDNDNDGFGGLGFDACGVATNDDCNENDNTINPGTSELCGNTIDENCNGLVNEDCAFDADGDGYSNIDDCDDSNAAIFPGQVEACNGIDDDCNNLIDDNLVFVVYYVDQDIDGYGTSESDTLCQAPTIGFATETGDCDDTDANINPGVIEAFNGIDDNCDGVIDEDMVDTDGDGIENGLDADDDNDGLLDTVEDDFNGDGITGDDCDNDGIPNTLDTDQCSIFIPEGFSPNKDGVNDVFEIQQLPYGAVVELEVYNRWGALVFESSDYKNTWTGVNNDDDALPSGVYYYVVRIAGEGFEKTHPLTIWR